MEFVAKLMDLISAIKARDFQAVAKIVGEILVLIAPLIPKPGPNVVGSDAEIAALCGELKTLVNEIQAVGADAAGRLNPETLKKLFELVMKILPFILPLILDEKK